MRNFLFILLIICSFSCVKKKYCKGILFSSDSHTSFQIDSTQTNGKHVFLQDTSEQNFDYFGFNMDEDCDAEFSIFSEQIDKETSSELVVYIESHSEGLRFFGKSFIDSIYVVEEDSSSWQGHDYYYYYYNHADSGGVFYETQKEWYAKNLSYGEKFGDGDTLVYPKVKVMKYKYGYYQETISSSEGGIISDNEYHHYDIKSGNFQAEEIGFLGFKYETSKGNKFGYVKLKIDVIMPSYDPIARIKILEWTIQK
ncbi:MAG: hypothetical protein WDZ35_10630 [Crocinitomicaceae bacterium]